MDPVVDCQESTEKSKDAFRKFQMTGRLQESAPQNAKAVTHMIKVKRVAGMCWNPFLCPLI